MSISERVLIQAKQMAASTGRTVSEVVEDALQESFARRDRPERQTFRMPTFAGQGVLAGVDLDDSVGLQDLMDQSAGIDRLR